MLRKELMLGALLETTAFQKGRRAYLSGADPQENQFSVETALHADWVVGWRQARQAETANKNREIAGKYSADTPFALGKLSAEDGLSALANPFFRGSYAEEQWRLGWAKGRASAQ